MSTTLVALICLIILLALLVLSLPVLSLLGFFETRTNGEYKFNTTRYVACIIITVLSSACLLPALAYSIIQLNADGANQAVKSMLLARTTTLIAQQNAAALYPPLQQKNTCFTIGISNWIEDTWKKDFRTAVCKASSCTADVSAQLKQEQLDINAKGYDLVSTATLGLKAIENVYAAAFLTAKINYNRMRSFAGLLDPSSIGQPDIGTNKEAYDEFKGFIAACDGLQPPHWITQKQKLLLNPMRLCVGECK